MTATYLLLRVALRRDRLRLAVWVLAIAGVMAGSAASTAKLYPSQADLDQIVSTIEHSPATLAFYGPPAQLDTIGGIAMWKPGGIGLVIAGLLGLLTVVRHTRAEEEVGLAELAGAGAVGREAALAAAVLLAVAAELVLGLFVGLGLAAAGADAGGSIGAGLSFTVVGVFFAAVAAVTAQVCASGRTAAGLAGAVLAASYLLRALADGSTGLSWVRWLSPIGWVQQLEPYAASPRWWALALPIGLAVLLVAAAVRLRARRDLGGSLLTERAGPAAAGRGLSGAFGLAWRLQRGQLAAWCLGFALLGGLAGWLAGSVGSLIGESSGTRELLQRLGGTQGLADTYLSASMGIAGVTASAYAVLAMLRLRTEEEAGRVEPLLAAALSRRRLVASYLAISLGGVAVMLALLGVVCGLTRGIQVGGPGEPGRQVGRLLLAALALAPGAWLLGGIAALLVGLAPRRSGLAWAVYGLFVVLGPLGAALGLPAGVQDLSPYTHVPHLPAASVPASDLVPLVVLTALAALAAGVGITAYRRRDIPA